MNYGYLNKHGYIPRTELNHAFWLAMEELSESLYMRDKQSYCDVRNILQSCPLA